MPQSGNQIHKMAPLGKAKRLVIKPGKVENRKTGIRKPERVKNRNEEKK